MLICIFLEVDQNRKSYAAGSHCRQKQAMDAVAMYDLELVLTSDDCEHSCSTVSLALQPLSRFQAAANVGAASSASDGICIVLANVLQANIPESKSPSNQRQ